MRLTILLIGCLLSGFLFTPGKGGMSSSPQRPWPGSIETREGVVHVLNPQEGLWGGLTGEPEVERVWSVGGAGGRDEEVFSFIQDITTDSYGNVYACDSREDRVAVFDRDGRLVRSIGRTGAGPGDLARPRVIEVDDRGRLHVLEWTNLRVSLFSPDGVFTGSFRIDGIFRQDRLHRLVSGNPHVGPVDLVNVPVPIQANGQGPHANLPEIHP